MSGNEAFELVTGSGWSRGLGNLSRSGLARWFKTRTWWIQSLIWGGVINLILIAITVNPQAPPSLFDLLMLFGVFTSLFPAVGVVIIMQDALVSEKREGTAAWVLSKPVTRHAFVLSKVISNSIGILSTMILVPCIIAYAVISIYTKSALSPLGFLGALAIIFVNHFFFLSLTMMLGSFFNARGPVIGIPLAILFLQQNLIGFLPILRFIFPWTLSIGLGTGNSLMFSLMTNAPIQPEQLTTLAIILIESLLFIIVCLWRFNREEF
jgi:ABC-2 type transport system permease protein